MWLKAVFNNIHLHTVRKANGKLRKLQEYIQQTEGMDEPDEDDSSDSNQVNSSSEDTQSDCDDSCF